MEFAQERRRELLLAATMDELIEFAQTIRVGGQQGFPVYLQPFQRSHAHGKRIMNLGELKRIGPALLDQYSKDGGWFGLVHVCKTWSML